MSDAGARPSPRPRPTPAPAPAHPPAPAPAVERRAESAAEPRFDPSSWGGAIILMALFVAALWIIQIANAHQNYAFNHYGLRPRTWHGLWGVLTAPFLHTSYDHLIADSLPLLLIGWVVLLAGWRLWVFVTLAVVLGGDLLTWVVGPGGMTIVGSSELFFGWLGYLIARAIFTRKIRWIVSAVMVLAFFGALLNGLAPVTHSQESWQAHVCGFAVGFAIGWFLHPRRRPRTRTSRTAVS